MKIALVILHADPAKGGAERYTVDLAAALARRGEHVSLLAQSFAAPLANVTSVVLGSNAPTRLGSYLRLLDALDEHLGHEKYDIVHAMLPVRSCDLYHPHAGLAAEAVQSGHLKYDNPIARGVAGVANRLNRKRQRFAKVERQLLAGPDAPSVLCLSDAMRAIVQRHYNIDPSKLLKLFNAIDLERFDPKARPAVGEELRASLGISSDKIVALIIAQDFHRKGLKEAIEATAAVDDPRLVLLVVGKQDPSAYAKHARELRVDDRVIFAGPTKDPYAFYRAADFFVLPTRHDPCSLVVLEALAMGLPVISTRYNGACEIMTHRAHGYVLSDPADVPAITQAMTELLDPAHRRAMSEAALALRPTLSYERHLDHLIEIYRRIADRNHLQRIADKL